MTVLSMRCLKQDETMLPLHNPLHYVNLKLTVSQFNLGTECSNLQVLLCDDIYTYVCVPEHKYTKQSLLQLASMTCTWAWTLIIHGN